MSPQESQRAPSTAPTSSETDLHALDLDAWSGASRALAFFTEVGNRKSWSHAYRVYLIVHTTAEICMELGLDRKAGETGGFSAVAQWYLDRLASQVPMLNIAKKTLINWKSQTYTRFPETFAKLDQMRVAGVLEADPKAKRAYEIMHQWLLLRPRTLLEAGGTTSLAVQEMQAISSKVTLAEVEDWNKTFGVQKS